MVPFGRFARVFPARVCECVVFLRAFVSPQDVYRYPRSLVFPSLSPNHLSIRAYPLIIYLSVLVP